MSKHVEVLVNFVQVSLMNAPHTKMSDSADGGDTKLQDAVDKVTIFCVKEDQVMTYVGEHCGPHKLSSEHS